MALRGVNPSYFAGMPTVARDPNAGHVSPEFAAMPGQALSEANALNQRRHEFNSGEAFKARELALQTEQQRSSAARDDRRLGMYQQGEDRRQTQQTFENDRLKSADTTKLVGALQSALSEKPPPLAVIAHLRAELQSRGWKGIAGQPGGASAATAMTGPAGAPPDSPIPEIPRQDMSWIESGKGTNPMSAADAATSQQLDRAEKTYMGALGGSSAKKAATGDAKLSSQLDAAGQRYSKGLSGGAPTPMPYEQALRMANQTGALGIKQVPGGWTPLVEGEEDTGTPYQVEPRRGLLPGKRMTSRVAQSSAMLSPGDPLNKITQ